MRLATTNGFEIDGRWSIDPDGRLHTNAGEDDEASEAWVAGDMLTMSIDGRAVSYTRAGDS